MIPLLPPTLILKQQQVIEQGCCFRSPSHEDTRLARDANQQYLRMKAMQLYGEYVPLGGGESLLLGAADRQNLLAITSHQERERVSDWQGHWQGCYPDQPLPPGTISISYVGLCF